jgi:hypothetical protein
MSTHGGSTLPPGSLAGLRGRHFVSDQDYSREELLGLFDLAAALKALYRRRVPTPFLRDRTLAMIFEHPSTRTRISFEAGMTELGGHAQYLRPGEIHLGGTRRSPTRPASSAAWSTRSWRAPPSTPR